jgi:hypothetical protein
LLETCNVEDSNKHTIEEIVRHVGHLPEILEDILPFAVIAAIFHLLLTSISVIFLISTLFETARQLNITCHLMSYFILKQKINLPTKYLEYAGSTLLRNFGQYILGYTPAHQNTAIFIVTVTQTSSLVSKKIYFT